MAASGGKSGWRFAAAALLLPAAILGTLAYVQRDLLAVRWHVRHVVEGAELDARTRAWLWDRRELAEQATLRHFSNPASAAGAARLLGQLLEPHGHDPDLAYLGLSAIAELHGRFPGLPAAGKTAAADLAVRFLGWHLADRFSGVPTLLDTAGEILRRALADADARVRGPTLDLMAAVWRLPAISGPPARRDRVWRENLCTEIAGSLTSDDPAIRARAAWALVDAPSRQQDKALKELLAANEPLAVRRAAFTALASGDDDRFGPPLRGEALAYLHDPDPRCRAAARQAARAQRDEAEVDWLVRATDPDPGARAGAAAALNGLPDRDFALAGLRRLAADADPAVRLSAARSAGAWRGPGAEPIVKQLSRDGNTAVSAAAARELQRLSLAPRPDRQ